MISGKLHSAGEHSDTFLRDVEGGEPKDSVDLEPAWTSEVYQDGGHGSDKPISSRQIAVKMPVHLWLLLHSIHVQHECVSEWVCVCM